MKRLTCKWNDGYAVNLPNALSEKDETLKWSISERENGMRLEGDIPNRLAAIEDILGDDYDLSRLRDLVQADREGRCIIAPVKPGEIAWGGHARFDPVLGETKNVIYPVILKGWWTGLKDYEYEPREFRFGDLYESYDAAEKALEGGKHG